MRVSATILALLLTAGCGAPADQAPANNVATGDSSSGAPAGNMANEAEPAAQVPEPAATVASTIPAAFQGDYDDKAESCGRPSEYKLKVSPNELRFHESIGTVRSVKVESPDRIEVLADYQGEGESWQNVRTLALGDGGKKLTVSGEGTEMVRVRCPAPDVGKA